MSEKPNCHICKHRGTVPGSAHSSCQHPLVKRETNDPLGNVFAILASVGRETPVVSTAYQKLGVSGAPYAIAHGWFNWPWDFDSAWLISCDGFEEVA